MAIRTRSSSNPLRARWSATACAGVGRVQLVYELADGSSLHITNAQWLTPNEQPIQGQGLTPDEVTPPGQDSLLWGAPRLLDDAN